MYAWFLQCRLSVAIHFKVCIYILVRRCTGIDSTVIKCTIHTQYVTEFLMFLLMYNITCSHKCTSTVPQYILQTDFRVYNFNCMSRSLLGKEEFDHFYLIVPGSVVKG